MEIRERRCPNEELARKYAKMLEIYYSDVEVFNRNGQWFVKYSV